MTLGSRMGVFLISGLNLLLEVLLTRVLSIGQGYHFAFMIVSLALLGIGASGSVLAVVKSRARLEETLYPLLVTLPVLLSLALVANYFVLNHYFIDRYHLSLSVWPWVGLAVFILSLSLPFFFSGMVLCLIFTVRAKEVGSYYALDLLGAAVGSLVFLPLGFLFAPHGLFGFLIVLGLLASFCFALEAKYRALAFLMGSVVIFMAVMALVSPLKPFALSPYKELSLALRYPGSKNLMVWWNAYSQVNLFESPAARFAPGLSLTFQENLPPQKGIAIDGEGLNGVTEWDGKSKEAIRFLAYLPSAVVYGGDKPERVLIVNANGGLSLLEAIYHDVPVLDVIERNPLVIKAVTRGSFFSPYQDDRVRVYRQDIRHFLNQSTKTYDRIIVSVTENPPAASSGLYGLTENYLFTREAFQSLLDHLKPGGFLTLTRYLFFPPREEPRLTKMVQSVLELGHVTEFGDHARWIQTWGTSTLIVKKGVLTSADKRRIKKFCKRFAFEDVTDKYLYLDPEESLFDLSVPTDDKPFFFQFIKISKIGELIRTLGGRWDVLLEGGFITWIVLALGLVFCLVFIILPLFFRRSAAPEEGHGRGVLFYFVLLGLGFMFIEMALLHRAILIFAHPSYAVSLVLFMVLFSSGLGSLYFHWQKTSVHFGYVVLSALVLLAVLFYLKFSALVSFLLSLTFLKSFLTLGAVFFPLGLVMGIPFAFGVRALGTHRNQPGLIPWAWALNATFSVIGAVLSVILARAWGFNILFLLAAGCYGLCLLFVGCLRVPPAPSRSAAQSAHP